MILTNLKNVPKSITLDDGETILLHPSQKNYKLPIKYQDDKILKGYEDKGIVRLIKSKPSVDESIKEKEVKVRDKKDKKGIFTKNISEEEGVDNE